MEYCGAKLSLQNEGAANYESVGIYLLLIYAVAAMAAAEATQNESLRLTATPDHLRYSDVLKTSIFPRRRMHALVACANRG